MTASARFAGLGESAKISGLVAAGLFCASVVVLNGCGPSPTNEPLARRESLDIELPAPTIGADGAVAEDLITTSPPTASLSPAAADDSMPPGTEHPRLDPVARLAANRTPAETASGVDKTQNPLATQAASAAGEAPSALTSTGAAAGGPSGPVTQEAFGDWRTWPTPQVVFVISGQQHGYIEPCGCTGLTNQKGGLARRFTLIQQLREKGWPVVPIDVGNQVRRFGRQPEIKFQTTVEGLKQQGYRAVGLGPDDLRLSATEVLVSASGDDRHPTPFVTSNVVIIDPSLIPRTQIVEESGKKLGITAVLDPKLCKDISQGDVEILEPTAALQKAAAELAHQQVDYRVLLSFGDEAFATSQAMAVPGFDLVVSAGGFGEPLYEPRTLQENAGQLVLLGDKSMYVCLVALYDDADVPMRYARIPLTAEFPDAKEMLTLLGQYQDHLRQIGLEGLGLRPIGHPTGRTFVGSNACADCHTTAFGIWEETPHAHATDSLVNPGERVEVKRHFDPECMSCHVTGWNAQEYYPYESGYASLEGTPLMVGNGCENCHGPGSDHVAAESGDLEVDEAQKTALREQMRLTLAAAKDRCVECHDLDNSPDFHKEGAFEKYWDQVKHYGKD